MQQRQQDDERAERTRSGVSGHVGAGRGGGRRDAKGSKAVRVVRLEVKDGQVVWPCYKG